MKTIQVTFPDQKDRDGNPFDPFTYLVNELNADKIQATVRDVTPEPGPLALDYTKQGRRPSAQQIVGDWKKAGSPHTFIVEYGETFAEFRWGALFDGGAGPHEWRDEGNGCRGVDRNAVVKALTAATRAGRSV